MTIIFVARGENQLIGLDVLGSEAGQFTRSASRTADTFRMW